ncbi:protein TRANSPARENT TESTA 12-like [Gossypium australe]|uniref:Protein DETOXIFICATION n=1 Tax=Gossypium australe TaxID=47621 RepID=A0A5B6VV57_9ROSI|nr:protein TRANSPARENT TESTA 12-like [Gossypium australe]
MDENLELRLIAEREEEEEKNDLKKRVWVETKKIWRIAFPSMLARVTSFGMIIVTQSFLGHIGELELATFALIQSIFVRFINGILIGMSSATETLCGQAFGAGQYHMMGIYLQRSWIVDGLMATVSVPLLVFASPIFKLLGQEEEIAEAAGSISLWFIPMLYQMVFQLTMQMYLQAQLKNFIVGWLSAFSFALHLLLSWIMVYKLNWGVAGAMGSLNICCWIMVVGEFVFIFGGWCPNTWKGFSKAALYDLWSIIKLSMASGLMICLELWYTAILVLLAGYMKNATIAIDAFSICLNFNAWEFMICLGLFGAAIVRVANELGRGNAKALKFAIKTIMSESICIGMVFFILCLGCWHQISYLFTSDEQVAQVISSLSDLLALSVLFNSFQAILTGVAIGAGFQGMVAIVNLGCYYIVGLPIGVVLGYVLNLQVTGLWIGLLSGVAFQIIILGFIVWRTNWDEQVEKASQRLNRWLINEENEEHNNQIQSLSQA